MLEFSCAKLKISRLMGGRGLAVGRRAIQGILCFKLHYPHMKSIYKTTNDKVVMKNSNIC